MIFLISTAIKTRLTLKWSYTFIMPLPLDTRMRCSGPWTQISLWYASRSQDQTDCASKHGLMHGGSGRHRQFWTSLGWLSIWVKITVPLFILGVLYSDCTSAFKGKGKVAPQRNLKKIHDSAKHFVSLEIAGTFSHICWNSWNNLSGQYQETSVDTACVKLCRKMVDVEKITLKSRDLTLVQRLGAQDAYSPKVTPMLALESQFATCKKTRESGSSFVFINFLGL